MAKLGKWIAGGLGFALGGPIGAILGFVLGSAFDNSSAIFQTFSTTRGGDFITSLLILAAAVVKADNKIEERELRYIRDFFAAQFGETKANAIMQLFTRILQTEVPTGPVTAQIKANMDYASRLQLLHFLFNISQSDGQVTDSEVEVIKRISAGLGISAPDFVSIRAMFHQNVESAYLILEISVEATNEEIRKAYRKMTLKYHPDKVAHLGEEFQQTAREKFEKVREAYERIKAERGFN